MARAFPAVLSAIALCAGWTAADSVAASAAQAGRQACGASFAGKWRTSYGIVHFRQEGRRVWGEHANGYIRGWAEGGVLEADWVELTDFGQGIGSLRLTLTPDRRAFSGTWRRLSGIGISSGAWNGKCLG